MPTRDPSIAPSAPVNGGTAWDIPSKDTLVSNTNSMALKAPSLQSNTGLDKTSEAEVRGVTSSKEGCSSSNKNLVRTTPTAGSELTCDPTFNFSDTKIQI
ncbi:hypothetical protein B0J17DRAFT_717463 [Rhizoctonia solani]|nr:hypothetical protein B0J17DRAFT_717463 [Rhizoctonia solani]